MLGGRRWCTGHVPGPLTFEPRTSTDQSLICGRVGDGYLGITTTRHKHSLTHIAQMTQVTPQQDYRKASVLSDIIEAANRRSCVVRLRLGACLPIRDSSHLPMAHDHTRAVMTHFAALSPPVWSADVPKYVLEQTRPRSPTLCPSSLLVALVRRVSAKRPPRPN